MISIIFSILPLFLILIGFLHVKKNGGFSSFNKRLYLKQQGVICYKCSCTNPGSDVNPGSNWVFDTKKLIWLCKPCLRDYRISQIDSRKKFYFRKISEFLLSSNFQKFGNMITILALSCILLQIVLYFFEIKLNLSPVSNGLLSVYWGLLVLRQWIVFK